MLQASKYGIIVSSSSSTVLKFFTTSTCIQIKVNFSRIVKKAFNLFPHELLNFMSILLNTDIRGRRISFSFSLASLNFYVKDGASCTADIFKTKTKSVMRIQEPTFSPALVKNMYSLLQNKKTLISDTFL